MANEKYLTTRELAEKLQVHINTVYNLVNKHLIPYVRFGTRYRFRESEIERWLNERGLSLDELRAREIDKSHPDKFLTKERK